MDEVLELLQRHTKRVEKTLEESKEVASKQNAVYERLIKSTDSTEDQKTKAFIGRMVAYDRLERLSSQLSLLYNLQIFAFKVKVMEISVAKIDEQLKSGALEKNNEIKDIKKHIDALKILVEAQYESLKEIKERNVDLPYIF